MKPQRLTLKLAAVAVLAVIVTAIAAPVAPPRTSISFTWDYDTNNLPDVFKMYTSTNLSVPLTNWSLVGTVSGTIRAITISGIPFQQSWYFVTASNWFGESPPSNIAGTPQPPSAVSNLRISLPP